MGFYKIGFLHIFLGNPYLVIIRETIHEGENKELSGVVN